MCGGKGVEGNFLSSFLDDFSEAPSWNAVLEDDPGWKDWNENPLKGVFGVLWSVTVSPGRLEIDPCCGFRATTVVGRADRGWDEKLAEVRGAPLERKVVTTGRGEVTAGRAEVTGRRGEVTAG